MKRYTTSESHKPFVKKAVAIEIPNFDAMSIDELKNYAKDKNIVITADNKDALIAELNKKINR